jgi:thiol-disulfide isomerase/thioredoxin
MIALQSQEQFEELLKSKTPPPIAVVYFTAKWCGPCKALKLQTILDRFKGITWYLCDVDENDYTPGYCGVKSFPSFLVLVNGKASIPVYQQSNTDKLIDWLSNIIDVAL